MSKHLYGLHVISVGLLFIFCIEASEKKEVPAEASPVPKIGAVFDQFMDTLLADGFSYPFGDGNGGGTYLSISDNKRYEGWYCAVQFAAIYTQHNWIHPGEDWNGNGGGNTDLGQPVFATARGIVQFANDCDPPWGKIVLISHRFMENGKIVTVYSQYAHLKDIVVKRGDTVYGREKIGSIGQDPQQLYYAHLHFEIRKHSMKKYPVDYWPSTDGKSVVWVREHYEAPSAFISSHRHLDVPVEMNQILIAVKHTYRMRLYERGHIRREYVIGLSQNPVGHKVRQGDNRLPEGAYRILQKSRGPFNGTYAAYFGPVWIRINYPNNSDAKQGFRKKLISEKQKKEIIIANDSGKWPPKNTPLGGGIGLHGWIDDQVALDKQNLTWGCISMVNSDIDSLYDLVKVGTRIVIQP